MWVQPVAIGSFTGVRGGWVPEWQYTGRSDHLTHLTMHMNIMKGWTWCATYTPNMYSVRYYRHDVPFSCKHWCEIWHASIWCLSYWCETKCVPLINVKSSSDNGGHRNCWNTEHILIVAHGVFVKKKHDTHDYEGQEEWKESAITCSISVH